MKTRLLLLCLVLFATACARVSVRIHEGDEKRSITVPFALVKAAFRLSDEGELEIDDLGGINEEFNLLELAKAFKEDGDKIKIEMTQGETHFLAAKQGNSFRITMEEPEEDRRVTLNLPMSLIETLAESEDQTVHANTLLKCLKRHKGVLVEVSEPGELIQIVMK